MSASSAYPPTGRVVGTQQCIHLHRKETHIYFNGGGIADGFVYPDVASDAARIAGPRTLLVRKSARLFTDGMSRRSTSPSRMMGYRYLGTFFWHTVHVLVSTSTAVTSPYQCRCRSEPFSSHERASERALETTVYTLNLVTIHIILLPTKFSTAIF
jgi:hypothetical protein